MTASQIASLLARQVVTQEAHASGRFSENGKPTRGRIAEKNLSELQEDINARSEVLQAALDASEITAEDTKETFEKTVKGKNGDETKTAEGSYVAVEFKSMAGVLAYFGGSEDALLTRLSKLVTDSFRNAARNDAFSPDATEKAISAMKNKITGGKVDKAALLAALAALE